MKPSNEIAKIVAWLHDYVDQAGANGYVVGLSGGIDSACTAVLCQRAAGDAVLGVLMPCHSVSDDVEMARLVTDTFGLRTVTVDLATTYDALLLAIPSAVSSMASANLKPRLRMATLYTLAQTHGYLVAGTGNKSELAVGYFTKYGDGGVDVEPLGDLYKWQVCRLAGELGIPQSIIDRPPSAGLWAGQTDEGEMGISYDELDSVLTAIETGQTGIVDPALLVKVQRMIGASAHKRTPPPICRL
jgi:NAD+ synthase